MQRRALSLILAVCSAATVARGQDCQNELCRAVASGSLSDLRWPDFADRRADVERFYQSSNYGLAWVSENQPVPSALALIAIFNDAARKGLDPEDYDASRWGARIAGLRAPDAAVERFDLALTVSVMRYVWALHAGRANPLPPQPGFEAQYGTDLATFVREHLLSAADPQPALESLEPPFEAYRRTEAALEKYLEMARAADAGVPLPSTAKPVDPGSSYESLPGLIERLRQLGDLSAEAAIAPGSTRYQAPVVAAVKRFQARHGLDPDGRIGTATLRELNTPLSLRVRQLQLTLERWRWVPRQFPRPPLVINIPEFILRTFDDSLRPALTMKVVVGKAYGNQTPVFAAQLKTIVIRPEWNVPISIQRKELLPQLRRDPAYLAKNHYEVVDARGNVVTSDALSGAILQQLRSGALRIRQTPGPHNALGLVEFNFPNENDVYLHDTPAQKLFAFSRRDFSHGCIRVEKAQQLAAWLLRDRPEWPAERIGEATAGDRTVTVTLAHPIPVLIVYGTALVLDSGEIRFFDDIYGLDASLAERLAGSYP